MGNYSIIFKQSQSLKPWTGILIFEYTWNATCKLKDKLATPSEHNAKNIRLFL